MHELLYPCSVAVIGVSSRESNLGRNIVANLVEFSFNGIVYAVGPRGGMIETRRIYPTLGDIPDKIDLAVILTPAKTVPSILEECGQKGIRWAIIESAGFREFTEEGQELEKQLVEISKRFGIRFIGPNCIGAINLENGFCVPFPRLTKFVKKGNVSIITQSGGVGMSALNLMANDGLGLNKFVSLGNMLDVNAEDMLEYLITDPGTEIIFMYLESIQNGRRLMEIAKSSNKPILAFKSNIGTYSKDIAQSHTASLTSDNKVVDAAFHQSGIIRIHDATSFGNNLKILELPPMKGKNMAIISRSGGHAIIASDACELSGFKLAKLPQSFLDEIEKHFRASVIRLTNPLDLGDLFDLNVYADIVEKTLQLDEIDGLVFLHTSLSEAENQTSRHLLEHIIKIVNQFKKPVAYYLSTNASEVSYLKQTYNFPIFNQVVETIRALEKSHHYYQMYQQIHRPSDIPEFSVNKEEVNSIIQKAHSEKRDLLLSESLEILERYGIATVRSICATSATKARAAAEIIGYPVAIKVISEQISHKSDIGGVQLNLRNGPSLAEAYQDMVNRIQKVHPEIEVNRVLVQPMITGGREIILGGKQDPQFGPVVLAGMGGIFVEIFNEVQVRVAPITRWDALEMLKNLRSYPILEGSRGHQRSDIDAIIEALLRLSQLLCDFPEIKEVDINPIRVFAENEGSGVLDARMLLQHPN